MFDFLHDWMMAWLALVYLSVVAGLFFGTPLYLAHRWMRRH